MGEEDSVPVSEKRRGRIGWTWYVVGSLLLAGLLGTAAPATVHKKLHQWGLEALSPFVWVTETARTAIENFRLGLKTLEETQAEVKVLRQQNAELAMQVSYLKNLAQENARLREMLGFKSSTHYRLLACRVASRDPASWWNTVLIDRGWADDENLTSDLPVVTPRGVVGKTGVVSRNVTEVILLVNENCKIAAITEASQEQGLLVGSGFGGEERPRARLTYVRRNAQVGIGERVFTTGLGGVFPSGLLLGVVAEVPPVDAGKTMGLYREVIVDPIVDLTQLDELFVVVSTK
ncbi:rod shape-determining protein MreC [Candidatus Methylacidithermus pantelleriae]|uniref:rod shape-determining protein MreC n=1 Tax=Candidatus Methylacidithermus pantelleriae TaxID=2744239 RepID=UPI00157DC683|nr:rod shape-determining protein MreC [Candidatus Methylacidithermus pantelleriae]